MSRFIVALLFAFVMVIGLMSGPTAALEDGPTPAPTPPETPADFCDPAESTDWEDRIDVQPFAAPAALVRPLDADEQDLYLVVWTIRPGTCIPFAAEGHKKDGAMVLMVQDGVVDFTARPYFEGSVAEVRWGRTDGEVDVVTSPETQRLYRGDWVTLNDQVWFALRAVGGESAVVLKAVWAKPPEDSNCRGSCR